MRADRLAGLLEGELHAPAALEVSGFATDSREVAPGNAFLAVRGERVDGHAFAPVPGASLTVAERPVPGPHVLVPDLVAALARFGLALRREFASPVVAVTGSAGKTTTKEFIAAALGGPVLRTRGNRNTEYTLPLVWTEGQGDDRAAVLEMGMRGFGQIAHLSRMSEPDVAVITGIGYSHLEKVGSREGIARAKAEIFEGLRPGGTGVLPADSPFLTYLSERLNGRRITFGWKEADVRLTGYAENGTGAIVRGEGWTARMPVPGRHLATNVAAAIAVATILGRRAQDAADRIGSATLPPLRMEWRQVGSVSYLLDTYNAAPDAVLGALATMADAPPPRYAVLGEMRELGDYAATAHEEIGRALAGAGLEAVLLIGPTMGTVAVRAAISTGFPEKNLHIAQNLDDVRAFLQEVSAGTVLVKGSRALELERALPEGG